MMIGHFRHLPLLALLSVVLLIAVFYSRDHQNLQRSRRRLSISKDLNTGENLRTVNGTIPEVSCPKGHYRPSGSTKLHRVSGNRQDGCLPCPRGRYGDTAGLTHSSCTAPCPAGTYNDREGATSRYDCRKCPTGTFGKSRGLTSSQCSGRCPKGQYSDREGATACKVCPKNYYMHQCPIDELIK